VARGAMTTEVIQRPKFRRKRSADSVLAGPEQDAFTLDEVAEHNTEDDCFIIVNGKVHLESVP